MAERLSTFGANIEAIEPSVNASTLGANLEFIESAENVSTLGANLEFIESAINASTLGVNVEYTEPLIGITSLGILVSTLEDTTIGEIIPDFQCISNMLVVGTGIQFIDKTTSLHSITKWLWDFGDGSKSTVPNPIHSYSEPGFYEINLTVSGYDGEAIANPKIIRITPHVIGTPNDNQLMVRLNPQTNTLTPINAADNINYALNAKNNNLSWSSPDSNNYN